jgi:hypothetical protein
MIEIGGSWFLGNLVLAFGIVTMGLFGPVFAVGIMTDRAQRPAREHPVRDQLARIRDGVLTRVEHAVRHGGHVIGYDWRYLDADGTDVTGRMHTGQVVAATAEAWRTGCERPQLLLRVVAHGSVWRVAPQGGHLGNQVYDAALWARPFSDPYAALAAVARHLRLTAVEG